MKGIARLRAGRTGDRTNPDASEPTKATRRAMKGIARLRAGRTGDPTSPDAPEPTKAAESAQAVAPSGKAEPPETSEAPEPADRRPFYPRLLRLRHVHPNAWQQALLGEGSAVVGGLLALADLASAWSVLVLPVAVAVVVKCHDLLAGLLTSSDPDEPVDAVSVGRAS